MYRLKFLTEYILNKERLLKPNRLRHLLEHFSAHYAEMHTASFRNHQSFSKLFFDVVVMFALDTVWFL